MKESLTLSLNRKERKEHKEKNNRDLLSRIENYSGDIASGEQIPQG